MRRSSLRTAVGIALILVIALGLQYVAAYMVTNREVSLLLNASGFAVAFGAVFFLLHSRGRDNP